MEKLIEETVERIKLWHSRWPKSAVLWSGGKDSTVMLHLMKYKAGISLPVVQWREPRFRERYAYSDMLVKEWELEMYDYPPSRLELASGPDVETGEMRFDMLKYYGWGKTAIILSLGTERPTDGKPYLCGVDDFFGRPKGSFEWPWAGVYIGTKNSDTDLIKGQVSLSQHIRLFDGGPANLYPIREWTDKDIFDYMEANGITPDPTRYLKVNGKWGGNPDKSMSADFYPLCVACIDRHSPKHVKCPKHNAIITNISAGVPYSDVVFEDLGFRPVWKDQEGKQLAAPIPNPHAAG